MRRRTNRLGLGIPLVLTIALVVGCITLSMRAFGEDNANTSQLAIDVPEDQFGFLVTCHGEYIEGTFTSHLRIEHGGSHPVTDFAIPLVVHLEGIEPYAVSTVRGISSGLYTWEQLLWGLKEGYILRIHRG